MAILYTECHTASIITRVVVQASIIYSMMDPIHHHHYQVIKYKRWNSRHGYHSKHVVSVYLSNTTTFVPTPNYIVREIPSRYIQTSISPAISESIQHGSIIVRIVVPYHWPMVKKVQGAAMQDEQSPSNTYLRKIERRSSLFLS